MRGAKKIISGLLNPKVECFLSKTQPRIILGIFLFKTIPGNQPLGAYIYIYLKPSLETGPWAHIFINFPCLGACAGVIFLGISSVSACPPGDLPRRLGDDLHLPHRKMVTRVSRLLECPGY